MDEEKKVEEVKARFIGDPNDDYSGPRNISMFGQDFEKGEYVTLKGEDVIRKVRGHNHFEIEGEEVERADKPEKDDLAQIGAGVGGLEALKDVARAEGVHFEDDVTKAKLMRAIRAHRDSN